MKIALIADIHSNLEALDSVLSHISKQGVTDILCIGDIVGYGANPNECATIIRQKKIPSVMGNHDSAALDMKCIEKFDQHAQSALRWTNKRLTYGSKMFLNSLPSFLSLKMEGRTILAVHGSLSDSLFGSVHHHTPDSVIKDMLNGSGADVVVVGHTHVPSIKRFGQKMLLNPGSMGQPRDNAPEASYMTLDLDTMMPQMHKVKYDIAGASGKILTSGLPKYLAERLFKGI